MPEAPPNPLLHRRRATALWLIPAAMPLVALLLGGSQLAARLAAASLDWVLTTSNLHAARFLVPVWPAVDYSVTASWTSVSPSPHDPSRGRADITVEVAQNSRNVAILGVTYVVARRGS